MKSREQAAISEVISKDEAVKTMQRSGYLLESRVSALLRENGWIVESNSVYLDPSTGKGRELDIHAISGATVYREEHRLSQVFQHLLIECVNARQPIVFIKSDSFLDERKIELIQLVSDPTVVWDDEYCWQLAPFLHLEDFHHYVSGVMATQFCSFVRKSGNKEWMAIHEDGQYGSFVALGQAVRFHSEMADGMPRRSMRRDGAIFPPHVEIFYPILIVEGELWAIDQTQAAPKPETVERINYKHSTFVDGVFEEYIITVTTEAHFRQFATELEEECRRIAERLREKRQAIENAQSKLADMDDSDISRLSLVRSPHLARIVAANIINQEEERRQSGPSEDNEISKS
jgi:hypothetical protein